MGRSAGLLLVAAACTSPPSSASRDDAAVVFDAGIPDAAVVDASTVPDADPNAPDGSQIADLTLNTDRLVVDLSLEEQVFEANACELDPDENCIGAPGNRRLLRFSVETPNVGTGDLELGAPAPDNPTFQFSTCHGHYHFIGYAVYRLLDGEGNVAAPGQKQAFCLLDSRQFDTEDPTVSSGPRFHCGFQGIQRGWADVYTANLPCQYIDVTGVPDGDYTLEVVINEAQSLPELSYDNNTVQVPVTIGHADLATPTEPCPDGLDAASTRGTHRECGWELAGTFACTPGEQFRAGCNATCPAPIGACTGDPMMRVCDHADPDGNCSASQNLDDADNNCGSQCPRTRALLCPDSGEVDVYVAPSRLGEAFTCDVQLSG